MQSNPAYTSEKIGSLDLLIVDEFQDFNETERNLVYLMSSYTDETIILGDDDQSIYEFKDADPDRIISLYNDERIERINHENMCYRCPDIIVDYCLKLIKHNRHRVDKVWQKSNKDGQLIFDQKLTQSQTIDYILKEVKNIKEYDNKGSILILSPMRFYVSDLMKRLELENIEFVDFWTNKIDSDLQIKIWWLKSIYGSHKIIFLLLLGKIFKFTSKNKFISIITNSLQSEYDEISLTKSIFELNYYLD